MAKHVWQELVSHCMDERPNEACGLLSGTNGRAQTIWRMQNTDNSPDSFSMHPRQIEKVLQLIAHRGEELVGIYHSHPTTPPQPSSFDLEHANYPEVAYLILSLANSLPQLGCYFINQKQSVPLKLLLY